MLLSFWSICALLCTNRARVSADAHTPSLFNIWCKSAVLPWLSSMSATRICIGLEQWSLTVNRREHSKNKRLTLLMCLSAEPSFKTADVPRLSDTDCVKTFIASQRIGSSSPNHTLNIEIAVF